ncbi:MAG: nuclease [Caulobacter sp.]|nr:nuclease [Caulobacter sp.]
MRCLIALTGLLVVVASPALADPCKAISDSGRLPPWLKPGTAFSGTVRYVGDGDSLCVGASPDPAKWVEVRIEDFDAPELNDPGGREAKAALARIAMGRRVSCRAAHRSYDRMVATCWLDGVSLGERMRRAGIVEGGR